MEVTFISTYLMVSKFLVQKGSELFSALARCRIYNRIRVTRPDIQRSFIRTTSTLHIVNHFSSKAEEPIHKCSKQQFQIRSLKRRDVGWRQAMAAVWAMRERKPLSCCLSHVRQSNL